MEVEEVKGTLDNFKKHWNPKPSSNKASYEDTTCTLAILDTATSEPQMRPWLFSD